MSRAAVARLEAWIFGHRGMVVALFALVTLALAVSAARLRVDAGFTKLLPLDHPYMQTFLQYREQFGGANRIIVALTVERGDIFTPVFFDALRKATDAVFFLPGVDRAQVRSLFTPNTRFTEVVEDGIAGGPVIPADFRPDAEGLERVRENVLKAGIVGRLVANDFSGALVSARLMEVDPRTGERLDYTAVADALERQVRAPLERNGIRVHIIGFAKVVGDVTAGARRVLAFFGAAFLVTLVLVRLYTASWRLTVLVLGCSLVAVIWQLGWLPLLGFGMDPFAILVPFLVFAIAVSHGVQVVGAMGAEVYAGAEAEAAARGAFRRLLLPGGVALASDTVGFLAILFIGIAVIREMALTASLGVASILFTNLVLLPVLLSMIRLDVGLRARLKRRSSRLAPLWRRLARVVDTRVSLVVLGLALALAVLGVWQAAGVRVGDLHAGVPELRPDSRYNRDTREIARRFSIGVDVLTVVAETHPDGCIDYAVMRGIDDFVWDLREDPGVRSAIALPTVARVINAGWNEGSLAWRVIPRNPSMLVQSVAHVPTDSGLLNADCSAMPVYVFTADHKAETIARIVARVKAWRAAHENEALRLRLAAGNVGVMAATNEVVAAAQFPILLYVFGAVVALCLLSFRSLRGTLCIVLPLALVSLLTYALMAWLEIGLKVNTLPVVALGAGIGVDYGIYIYSRLAAELARGDGLAAAFERALRITGSGVVFTGLTLASGVATWIFSPLQFQADMGILLTFMFLVNMLGAILLLPALARWLLPRQ